MTRKQFDKKTVDVFWNDKKKTKRKSIIGNTALFGVIHFSLMMTCIIFPLIIFENIIKSMPHILLEMFFTLLFMFGGLGLYMVFVIPLAKLEKLYYT